MKIKNIIQIHWIYHQILKKKRKFKNWKQQSSILVQINLKLKNKQNQIKKIIKYRILIKNKIQKQEVKNKYNKMMILKMIKLNN